MDEFLTGLIDQRRVEPREDLLSNLISVEEAGDRLSPSELLSVVAMLLVAGTDTTRNQLGGIINTFAEHPEQWALLRAQPELLAGAVEEASVGNRPPKPCLGSQPKILRSAATWCLPARSLS